MFDTSRTVFTQIRYQIHRLHHVSEIDNLWFQQSESYGQTQRVSREERRERYMRGLRDPENEANAYLRHTILEAQHTAAHHLLTEIVYGERQEDEKKTVDVPYSTPRWVPYTHLWSRWEPKTWWDRMLAALPDLLFFAFIALYREEWRTTGFHGGAQHTFAGTTPYTYVETRKWLRDPFIEDRFGKLDKDRVDMMFSVVHGREPR